MLVRAKIYRFSLLMLIALLLLTACGDNTATTAPTIAPTTVPVPTVTATAAPTTAVAAATTSAVVAASTTTAATVAANSGELDPQKVEAGRKVFVAQCQLCHLNGGKSSGGPGPSLALSRKALDANKVRENVRKGEAAMPAFDQTKVTDADLENIVVYLRSIHLN
jgi:mono/diheme cytochrome c family protein